MIFSTSVEDSTTYFKHSYCEKENGINKGMGSHYP